MVFGQRYVPDTTGQPYRKQGIASWYGKKFHGNSTSIGEPYDMYAMTAAHTTLPVPSYARVTSLVNGRTVIVRVNDRGPFHSDRIMDLSTWRPTSWASSARAAARWWWKASATRSGAGLARPRRRRRTVVATGSQPVAEPVAAAPVALTPVALPATPQAPTPAGGIGNVYLQVGAFSQPANAQTLVSRINAQLARKARRPP